MVFLRSLAFNVAFYVNLLAHLLAGVPALLLPRRAVTAVVHSWGCSSLWLLRVICDVKVEFRGREKIPAGALIVAAKHQSVWETFVLPREFTSPAFVLKRELMWIPIFGWMAAKFGCISVDRSAGARAMGDMLAQARRVVSEGRQIVIFPEGTRRAAGAPPAYKFGVARHYGDLGVPCLPVALNSGLFWPRRKFARHPGTIVIEYLDPIPPGLEPREFFGRLQEAIEAATARLVAEGRGGSLRAAPAAGASESAEAG